MRDKSKRNAQVLLLTLMLLLLLGTQMPGAWRDEAFRVAHLPWQMTKVAHVVLFAAMAGVATWRPLCMPLKRVLVGVVVLAVLTELLQHWVPNRNPSVWDVGFDIGGALLGCGLARWGLGEIEN